MRPEIRSALRIVAIDGPADLAREAMRRLDGRGAPVMWEAILRTAATRLHAEPLVGLPQADHHTIVAGALAAAADTGKDPQVVLEAGHAAGMSLRAMAAPLGISHVAVTKRLTRE